MKYIRKTVNFIGKITSLIQNRDWNINEIYYTIKIETDEEELSQIKVYQRKVSEEMWREIENNECLNKNYIFTCEKHIKVYHLKEWKLVN